MVDRVLAARCLHAHRAVGSDEPVAAVAAADRPVVSHLGRGAGDGQEHALFFDVVSGVDMDNDLALGALLCNRGDLFF